MAKDDLRPEYDFNKLGQAARGKYARDYKESKNIVLLDDDIAQAFPDEKAVNDALRLLIDLAKKHVQVPAPKI